MVTNLPVNAGDTSSIPDPGRSPGETAGTLAWTIPWTEEPGGLQSLTEGQNNIDNKWSIHNIVLVSRVQQTEPVMHVHVFTF